MASSSQLPSLHGIQVDPDVLSTFVAGSPQFPTEVEPYTARPAEQAIVLDVIELNGFPAHSPSMWHTWVGSSGADEVSPSQVIQDDPVDKFLNPFLHRD